MQRLIALGLVLAASSTAAARDKLVLAPLRIGAGLPADSNLGAQILTHIAAAIDETPALVAAYDVAPPAQTKIQFFAAGCYEPGKVLLTCIGQFAKETGADHVLFGTLSLVEGRYKVELRAFTAKDGAKTLTNAGEEGTATIATDWSDATNALRGPLKATLKVFDAPPAVAAAASKDTSSAVPPVTPPPPQEDAGSGLRLAGWISGGLGLVALAAGGLFAYQTRALADDLSTRYRAQGSYLAADEEDLRAVQSGNTRATVALGVGVALVVASGGMLYAAPAPSPGGGAMLALGGRF